MNNKKYNTVTTRRKIIKLKCDSLYKIRFQEKLVGKVFISGLHDKYTMRNLTLNHNKKMNNNKVS